MTFKEAIAELAQKLGVEIDGEGDSCALMAKAKDGTSVTVWMQGYDERGAVLTGADLGAPPPERLESKDIDPSEAASIRQSAEHD